VAIDKGDVDFSWWKQIAQDGAYFVTRFKQDLNYQVIAERVAPKNSHVRHDVEQGFDKGVARRLTQARYPQGQHDLCLDKSNGEKRAAILRETKGCDWRVRTDLREHRAVFPMVTETSVREGSRIGSTLPSEGTRSELPPFPMSVQSPGRGDQGFRGSWETACKAAGVPDLNFYGLCRTAVKNMKIIGHKADSIERRYNIVDSEDLTIAELMERRRKTAEPVGYLAIHPFLDLGSSCREGV
jgi:hypothetical protein